MARRSLAYLLAVLLGVSACEGKRDSPVPSTSSAPSVAATPAATPGPSLVPSASPGNTALPTREASWQRIATLKGSALGVVGFEDGYVVLANDGVQFSADGLTWNKHVLPSDHGLSAVGIATNGRRVVVTGAIAPCAGGAWASEEDELVPSRCREQPSSWVSDDGRTWRRATWAGPIQGDEQGGSTLASVWALPTGGWEALQGFWAGDLEEDPTLGEPTLWRSDDGLHWDTLGGFPDEATKPEWFGDGFPSVAVDATGQRIGVVDDFDQGRSRLFGSTDGWPYHEISGIVDVLTRVYASTATSDGNHRWFLIGSTTRVDATGNETSHLFLRSTTDLATWTPLSVPLTAEMEITFARPIGFGALGYVLVADTDIAGYVRSDATWLSDDGIAWRLADVGSLNLWGPQLVDGPAGFLAIGSVEFSEYDYGLGVARLAKVDLP